MATVIITTFNDKGNTIDEITATEIQVTGSDLHGTTGMALVDGEWIPVFKDHAEGPYCDWRGDIENRESKLMQSSTAWGLRMELTRQTQGENNNEKAS